GPVKVGVGRDRTGVAFSDRLTLDVLALEATAVISGPEAVRGRADVEQLASEYLERWLAHVRGRGRAVTFEGYAGLVRRHALPRLGSIPRVARRLAVDEGSGHLVVGVGVVVDHPRRQRDRRVEQRVADRLGPGRHLHEIAVAARLERLD